MLKVIDLFDFIPAEAADKTWTKGVSLLTLGRLLLTCFLVVE